MRSRTLCMALWLAACPGVAGAELSEETEALVDALVSRKVLTRSEAESVKDEVAAKVKGRPAPSRIALAPYVDKLSINADLRLRYQYTDSQDAFDVKDNGKDHPDGVDKRSDASLFRYAFRFGMKAQFADGLEFGFRLASGQKDGEIVSTNDTLGDAFAKDGIWIDAVYVKYQPRPWVTVWAGKFDQPFWTTDMMWDTDVTVEGFAQQFSVTWGGTEVFGTLGEIVFGDIAEADEDTGLAGDGYQQVSNDDGWLFLGQVGARTTWRPGVFETKAAVGYWYWANAGDLSSGQRTVNNGVTYPSPGSGNNLGGEFELLDVMAEATWRVGGAPAVAADPKDVKGGAGHPAKAGFPIKPYAHLVWNLAPAPNLGVIRRSGDHTQDAQNNPDDVASGPRHWEDLSSDFAWRVGVKLGDASQRGRWELNTFYQQVGSDAVPDTFNDGDFGNGYTNVKGFGLRAAYALRDNVTVAFRLLNSDFLDPDIQQDTNNGNPAQARTMQFDFNLKF